MILLTSDVITNNPSLTIQNDIFMRWRTSGPSLGDNAGGLIIINCDALINTPAVTRW